MTPTEANRLEHTPAPREEARWLIRILLSSLLAAVSSYSLILAHYLLAPVLHAHRAFYEVSRPSVRAVLIVVGLHGFVLAGFIAVLYVGLAIHSAWRRAPMTVFLSTQLMVFASVLLLILAVIDIGFVPMFPVP
jgi:hypothetical protein